MIIYGENNETIEIPFPENKYNEYLGDKISQELTTSEQRKLFVRAIDDFLKGKLCIDELAAIAGYEWNKMSNKEKNDSDLGDSLYAASELSYYVRHMQDTDNQFTIFMNRVINYYNQFKALLA